MTGGAFPKAIRVGGIDYTIARVRGLHAEDGQKLSGHIIYDRCRIEIERDLAPASAQQVLWHEALHALLTHSGRNQHDEGQIEVLSYGLMALLRDNPWLAEAP